MRPTLGSQTLAGRWGRGVVKYRDVTFLFPPDTLLLGGLNWKRDVMAAFDTSYVSRTQVRADRDQGGLGGEQEGRAMEDNFPHML